MYTSDVFHTGKTAWGQIDPMNTDVTNTCTGQ